MKTKVFGICAALFLVLGMVGFSIAAEQQWHTRGEWEYVTGYDPSLDWKVYACMTPDQLQLAGKIFRELTKNPELRVLSGQVMAMSIEDVKAGYMDFMVTANIPASQYPMHDWVTTAIPCWNIIYKAGKVVYIGPERPNWGTMKAKPEGY